LIVAAVGTATAHVSQPPRQHSASAADAVATVTNADDQMSPTGTTVAIFLSFLTQHVCTVTATSDVMIQFVSELQ